MQTTLTHEQMQIIKLSPDKPVSFVDPETNCGYTVLRSDLFDRVAEQAGEIDPSFTYAAVDEVFAEGWNHPSMDVYDRYEEFKK